MSDWKGCHTGLALCERWEWRTICHFLHTYVHTYIHTIQLEALQLVEVAEPGRKSLLDRPVSKTGWAEFMKPLVAHYQVRFDVECHTVWNINTSTDDSGHTHTHTAYTTMCAYYW